MSYFTWKHRCCHSTRIGPYLYLLFRNLLVQLYINSAIIALFAFNLFFVVVANIPLPLCCIITFQMSTWLYSWKFSGIGKFFRETLQTCKNISYRKFKLKYFIRIVSIVHTNRNIFDDTCAVIIVIYFITTNALEKLDPFLCPELIGRWPSFLFHVFKIY